ncbi:hypothetical protein KI387_006558 [Taxus chinensis]|uniref:Uncharacterized protein n=1 Tax=Taxus chinensis TaxID=29808 RepID=A0AA38GQR1_TAXCH|nr:hypothetical protein KI387_006558 [Taxus chinensis]
MLAKKIMQGPMILKGHEVCGVFIVVEIARSKTVFGMPWLHDVKQNDDAWVEKSKGNEDVDPISEILSCKVRIIHLTYWLPSFEKFAFIPHVDKQNFFKENKEIRFQCIQGQIAKDVIGEERSMSLQRSNCEGTQPLVVHGDITRYETSGIFDDSYSNGLFTADTEHTRMTYEESKGDRGEEIETHEMDDGDGVAWDSVDAGQEEIFPRKTIATLFSTLMFKAFRIRVMQGQRVGVLIDSRATHNCIDASLYERRGLQTKDFEGLNGVVANGESLRCTRRVPLVSITMGNYTVTNDFHIVGMGVTNIALRVQWLHSLGAPRVVTAEGKERTIQHGEEFYYCGSMWSMMDVGVASNVAHEAITEIGITGSDHLSLSLCWSSEVSVDWRPHLLVEYSKDRHTCEILDGHIQDDNYRLEDEMLLYQGRLSLAYTVCHYDKSELTGSSFVESIWDNTPMLFAASMPSEHFTHVLVSGETKVTHGYSVGSHSTQEVDYVALLLPVDCLLESWDFSFTGHIEIRYEELGSHTSAGQVGELAPFVRKQVVSQANTGDSTGFRVNFHTQELIGEAVGDSMMTALHWQGLDRLEISVWIPVESRFGYHSASRITLLSVPYGGHDDGMGFLGYFGLHGSLVDGRARWRNLRRGIQLLQSNRIMLGAKNFSGREDCNVPFSCAKGLRARSIPSRGQTEGAVKRDELLQFVRVAITGLKLNAELARIDAEVIDLNCQIAGKKLPDTRNNDLSNLPERKSGEAFPVTIEGLKRSEETIRKCSRLHFLLERKKAILRRGDSEETRSQKVDKLRLLAESLAVSTIKAEKQIADNRHQKEDALNFRVAKANEVAEIEKELLAEIEVLDRRRVELEEELKKVNVALSAVNKRRINVHEEREQFFEASTQIVSHLKKKEDELMRSVSARKTESVVVNTWTNFLEDTWILQTSQSQQKEQAVKDALEEAHRQFLQFVISNLPKYKEDLHMLLDQLQTFTKFIEDLSNKSLNRSQVDSSNDSELSERRKVEEQYLEAESQTITTFRTIDSMKAEFYEHKGSSFRNAEEESKALECFGMIDQIRQKFEAMQRPTLEAGPMTPKENIASAEGKPSENDTEKPAFITQGRQRAAVKISS